ncbi:hypothetical protein NE237_019842 [Protea cynaroides]|uniref:GDSL esterase/lipase At5g03980-like n=1 Tax=Protea cynaroides TaxID=273540 RepID=A0A9Q0H4X3_9MAGN|nr:hypothetical protein NE237_019842 [Protea cynaroides]
MASSQTSLLIFSFLLILTTLSLLVLPSSATFNSCSPNSIYQLGDSISDTGNLIRESKSAPASAFAHLPYGISFFRQPTGRCSNGLLMIDYLALSLHLPLLNPYLAKHANFTHGVNFAVAGSTALNSSFLAENHINSPVTNSSLSVQLSWLKSYLKSTCHTEKECKEKLKRSFFFMGEIGGNDYNYAFLQGKPMDELQKSLVPHVVQSIHTAIMEVINLGAARVVVPGNFPIGCFPMYLTAFQTNDTAAYDEFKCLKSLNSFAMFHNDHLQRALHQLRKKYPKVDIVYANYYNAFKWVFDKAPLLGFDKACLLKSCCGSGGKYNFDLRQACGVPEATVCSIPDTHISWDGIHLTEKTYMHMASWIIRDLTPKIKCLF